MKAKKTKKKKKGLRVVIILVILVVVVGGIILFKKGSNTVDITPIVKTVHATRGDLQEEVSSTGNIAGIETVNVYAPASGTILSVSVRTGDEIEAGASIADYDLAKLEESMYQAKLQNEKSQLAYDNTVNNSSKGNGKVKEAKVNLNVLEQQIEDHTNYLKNLQKALADYQVKSSNDAVLANYNLKKQQADLTAKLATKTPGTTDYDDTEKALESVNTQLEQLALSQSLSQKSAYQEDLEKKIAEEQETIADLQEYQAKMQAQKSTGEASVLDDFNRRTLEIDKELTDMAYQKLLDEAELARQGIISEVQGVVTSILVTPGSPVSEGMQILTMERTDKLIVKSTATKYAMERLKVGQKVEVTAEEHTYKGVVSHIDRIATQNNMNAASVGFEVEIQDKDEFLYVGMEVKLSINTNSAENVLQLPAQAVNVNKEGDFVYVVRDGMIAKKSVKVGFVSHGMIQIIDGITESDEIVTDYKGNLEEGMAVIAQPEQQ